MWITFSSSEMESEHKGLKWIIKGQQLPYLMEVSPKAR